MKNRLMLSAFMSLFYVCTSRSAIGCMDNSKHTDTSDGYDYKTYHHVSCTCPCDSYPHYLDRGQCMKCGHYRMQ